MTAGEKCWDCKHALSNHSGEYPGWDLRGVLVDDWPAKKLDEGCTVPGCGCRRWFERVPAASVSEKDERTHDAG